MKTTKLGTLTLTILLATGIFSCVPLKEFEDLENKHMDCEEARGHLEQHVESLQVDSTEMAADLTKLKKRAAQLVADTALLGQTLRETKESYAKMQRVNNELINKLENVKKGSAASESKLMAELEELQNDLQIREDRLRELEARLDERRRNLDELQNELENKNKRLVELEQIISRRDSLANSLRTKLEKALATFRTQGLSIEKRGDRIYVSLDEKLLFQSGKWEVDPQGQEAIKKLAGVLEQSQEVNVLIEGHTDDVPLRGKGDVLDNWDLSVKRATAIVRIIIENSEVDPKRITAAGRSKYMPVDPAKTEEARQKNRRTEIILIPNIDYSDIIEEKEE